MAWSTPKTDWTTDDGISTTDMNRMEGNSAELLSLLGSHVHNDGSGNGESPLVNLGSHITGDLDVSSHTTGILPGANGGVPVGMIGMFSGSGTPTGWLLCDGSTFSSSTYPDLYSWLGTTTLPDLRGRFIVGVGTGGGSSYSTGDTGGAAAHSLTENELPNHTHGRGVNTGDTFYEGLAGSGTGVALQHISTAGNDDTGEWTAGTGGGNSHENRPPYHALRYFIRAAT